jgi:ABC-type transport system substrate-binding protein
METMLRYTYEPAPAIGVPTKEGLATDWQVAPDLSSITFKLRKGVQFHKGYGEMTAEDVVFSWNNMLKEGSRFARVGEWGRWMQKWEVVDSNTAKAVMKPGRFDPTWTLGMSNLTGGMMIASKKVFDQLGEEKMITTAVGTGPFEVQSWVANQEVRAEAVTNHWRQTPRVKELRIREIKETSTLLAALRTGEVQIGLPPLKNLKALLEDTKGRAQPVGLPAMKSISFAGNYWMDKNQDTGEPVAKRAGFKPDAEHPWIGDPWAAGCNTASLLSINIPQGQVCESMERARKVRWALSMAIDRELINKKLLDGFGKPGYAVTNFSVTDPRFKKDWLLPLDVAKAKQLLKEAGYEKGFKAVMYTAPDVPAVVDTDIGEAIVQMWRDNLGLDITIESTAYTARRPTMVSRSIDVLFQWQHDNVGQIDNAKALGALVTTGWNHGIENPVVAEIWKKNLKEVDGEKRIAKNVALQDYLTFWQLWAAIVEKPNTWAVRPEVAEWKPWTETAGFAGSFETVVLK